MQSVKSLKKGLHDLIESVDDQAILSICKQILEREKERDADFWDELSDEEKAGIERGLEDVEAGRVYTHEEVMKGIKEKFNL